jgi:very-short-patch-repair endonuclease
MQRFLKYNRKIISTAKELRKNMTEPEKKIWFQFFKYFQQTYKIRVLRQRTIKNFIVDFYIPKIKLVIEID